MRSITDEQLLREYTDHRSEAAFEALVHRHVNAVYAAALRQVSNPEMAEDVTQSVFLLLAQKHATLGRTTVLSGWLYRVTHYAVKHALRSHYRQERLKSMVLEMNTDTSVEPAPENLWRQLEPMLDEAMNRLRSIDRNALVLRFFDGLALREVGAALGMSEEAAKKRVSRALAKLNRYFRRKGLLVPIGVLTAGLANSSASAAPTQLVSLVINSTAAGLAAPPFALALARLTLKELTIMKAKKISMVSALSIGLISGGLFLFVPPVNRAAISPSDDHRIGGPGNPRPDWRALIAENPQSREAIERVWCIDNLRQIGAAAYYWARTHGDLFPEDLLRLGENAHWQISPIYLKCPSDQSKREATSWAEAKAEHVSYVVTDPVPRYTEAVQPICRCPVHGQSARSDGTAAWKGGTHAEGGIGHLLAHVGVRDVDIPIVPAK